MIVSFLYRANKLILNTLTWCMPFIAGYSTFTGLEQLIATQIANPSENENYTLEITLKYALSSLSALLVTGTYLYALKQNRRTNIYTMADCISELKNEISLLDKHLEGLNRQLQKYANLQSIFNNDLYFQHTQHNIAFFKNEIKSLSKLELNLEKRKKFHSINLMLSLIEGFNKSNLVCLTFKLTNMILNDETLRQHEKHALYTLIFTPLLTLLFGSYYFYARNNLANHLDRISEIDLLVSNVHRDASELRLFINDFGQELSQFQRSPLMMDDHLFTLMSNLHFPMGNTSLSLKQAINKYCSKQDEKNFERMSSNLTELALNHLMNSPLDPDDIAGQVPSDRLIFHNFSSTINNDFSDLLIPELPSQSFTHRAMKKCAFISFNAAYVLMQLIINTYGFYFFIHDSLSSVEINPIMIALLCGTLATIFYGWLQYDFNKIQTRFSPSFNKLEETMSLLSKQDELLERQMVDLGGKIKRRKKEITVAAVSLFKQDTFPKQTVSTNERQRLLPLINNSR